MKIGTATAAVIPENAKLVRSTPTFVGADEKNKQMRLHVEDQFDVDGDDVADIVRTRAYVGGMEMLNRGLIPDGGTIERERFVITNKATGDVTYADDPTGAGKISSTLTVNARTHSVFGEKDLDGDGRADKRVEQENGRVKISTSTRKDGVFDVVESPKGGFGW